MTLYHVALANTHDSRESQAVRENITTLFQALDIYFHDYIGEKRDDSSDEEE